MLQEHELLACCFKSAGYSSLESRHEARLCSKSSPCGVCGGRRD